MSTTISFAYALVYLAALSTAVSPPRVAMEMDVTHTTHSSHWNLVGSAPSDVRLHFTAALRVDSDAAAQLESAFWAVSDPDHDEYGRHWSQEAVRKLPFLHHVCGSGFSRGEPNSRSSEHTSLRRLCQATSE